MNEIFKTKHFTEEQEKDFKSLIKLSAMIALSSVAGITNEQDFQKNLYNNFKTTLASKLVV